jgi:hypothetical protein
MVEQNIKINQHLVFCIDAPETAPTYRRAGHYGGYLSPNEEDSASRV